MGAAFFGVLPRERLRYREVEIAAASSDSSVSGGVYDGADEEDNIEGHHHHPSDSESANLLLQTDGSSSSTTSLLVPRRKPRGKGFWDTLYANLARTKSLFLPYMLPLLLVYISEYLINQSLTPTLLFPLPSTPFKHYKDFYPTYATIYQTGVFVSRSSHLFLRVNALYPASLLQCLNFVVLLVHALWPFLPSVWIVFGVIFWEGLLGGAVYVNTFARIAEEVKVEEREFSLGAVTVGDSGGICVAGFVGLWLEGAVCGWQTRRGRGWCGMT